MPGEETPRFDREEVFRRLLQMSPGELAAVLESVDSMEREAAEELGVRPRYTGEGAITLPLSEVSGTGTVVNPVGIPSEAALGEVHVTQGTATARATAVGATVWTSWAVGAIPPLATPSPAVNSLLELIKPKSTQDALAISHDIRRWVLVLFFIIMGGTKTPGILEALQQEFVTGTVQEEVLPEAPAQGDPSAE